jgi:hypothetical protein
MSKLFNAVTHVGLSTMSGALKGLLWAGAAALLLAPILVPLAGVTGLVGSVVAGVGGLVAGGLSMVGLTGAAAGVTGFLGGMASLGIGAVTSVVGGAAAIGGVFGLMKGLGSLPQVEAESVALETRKNAQMQMAVALQERQHALENAGRGISSVTAQRHLPGQQQGYAQGLGA